MLLTVSSCSSTKSMPTSIATSTRIQSAISSLSTCSLLSSSRDKRLSVAVWLLNKWIRGWSSSWSAKNTMIFWRRRARWHHLLILARINRLTRGLCSSSTSRLNSCLWRVLLWKMTKCRCWALFCHKLAVWKKWHSPGWLLRTRHQFRYENCCRCWVQQQHTFPI